MAERTGKRKQVKNVDISTLEGIWRSYGYGNLLAIGPKGYTLYEETGISCLPVFGGSLDELAEHYVDVQVSPGGQTFSALRATGMTRIRYRRLKSLPQTFSASASKQRLDPVFNFEVFWHTFAEHYALFKLKGMDWQSAYAIYRPMIDADVEQRRLFQVFVDMLRPLSDGHVQLHTTCGHFNAGASIPLYDRLAVDLDRADDTRDVASYLADLREWLRDTIQEDYLQSHSRSSCNRHLQWGQLDDATGYLAIRAMAGLSGRLGHPRLDLQAVDGAMGRAMKELGQLAKLVIDLRGNGGGYDAVALRLASYLIDRKRLAFSKFARRGAGYTAKQHICVEPRGKERYLGRLVVLTSGLTASAAEVFILALLQHPQLTLVGEPTSGILSDALERHLPNGWFLTLSNEIYHAADGKLYEHHGIPPHIEIPFFDRPSLESGRDPMLDFVMDMEDTAP